MPEIFERPRSGTGDHDQLQEEEGGTKNVGHSINDFSSSSLSILRPRDELNILPCCCLLHHLHRCRVWY